MEKNKEFLLPKNCKYDLKNLAGVVVGGLLGELASKVDFLWWLGYGNSFGLSEPLVLDLSIIKITFALVIKVNIASIIGVLLAILIYRKV